MYIPRHIRLFFSPDIVRYLEEGKFPEVMQQVSILADFLHTQKSKLKDLLSPNFKTF